MSYRRVIQGLNEDCRKDIKQKHKAHEAKKGGSSYAGTQAVMVLFCSQE